MKHEARLDRPVVVADDRQPLPPEQRLVNRYGITPLPVELVVTLPSERSPRRPRRARKIPITTSTLARMRDISVAGVKVDVVAEPSVPPGARLELLWSETAAEVRVANRHIDRQRGLVELGLEFRAMTDGFRRLLYEAVGIARGAPYDLEDDWNRAQ